MPDPLVTPAAAAWPPPDLRPECRSSRPPPRPRLLAPVRPALSLVPARQVGPHAGATWPACRARAFCALAAMGWHLDRIARLRLDELPDLQLPRIAWHAIAVVLEHARRPRSLAALPSRTGRFLTPDRVLSAILRHGIRVRSPCSVRSLRAAFKREPQPFVKIALAPPDARRAILSVCHTVGEAAGHMTSPAIPPFGRPATGP